MALLSFRRIKLIDAFYLSYPLLSFAIFIIEVKALKMITNSLYIIFFNLASVIGGSFQIIPDCINHLKKKQNKQSKTAILISNYYSFTKIEARHDFQNKLITFICIFSLVLITISLNYSNVFLVYSLPNPKKSNFLFYVLFLICFDLLFMKVLLKFTLYRHHFVSIGLIMFGLISLHFYRVDFYQFIDIVPYYLLFAIPFSFCHSYLKYAMKNKFILPLQLSFFYGLSGLLIIGIFYLICYCENITHPYLEDVLKIPETFNAIFSSWDNIFMSLIYLILMIVNQCGNVFIVYKSAPVNASILTYANEIFFWIFDRVNSFGVPEYFVISLIGSLCYITGILMFLEILIVNYFGLSKNTTEFLEQKAFNEDKIYAKELIEISEETSSVI